MTGMSLPVFYVRYKFTCSICQDQVWINLKFMSCMMSLPRLLFNVWYEFTCFFYVRYGITLFHSAVMLLPPPPCLFRRTSMRDCMSWSPSWALLTACISSEESVRESSKQVVWCIHMHQTFYCFNRSNRYSFSTKIYWIIDQYWSKFLKI